MDNDTRAPTLGHDIGAIATLYLDLARLMTRRLTRPSRWDRYQFYRPIEIVRRDEETEPKELVRS